MKNAWLLSILSLILLTTQATFAQTPHSTPEQREKAKLRSDYGLLKRQIASLKEFAEERSKIPALQKENKMLVKVVPTVDSVDDEKVKTITGYITQIIGDNTSNAYEVIFDRATRKITSVKRTEEAVEPEAEQKARDKQTSKKAAKKSTTKAKDGEEEEDEEERPQTGKEKEEE